MLPHHAEGVEHLRDRERVADEVDHLGDKEVEDLLMDGVGMGSVRLQQLRRQLTDPGLVVSEHPLKVSSKAIVGDVERKQVEHRQRVVDAPAVRVGQPHPVLVAGRRSRTRRFADFPAGPQG